MQKKRNKKKLDLRKIVVRVLFISVLLYSGYILASQQVTIARKEVEVEKCNMANAEAMNEQAKLKEETELADTDEYKEQKAREYLGYSRPEEKIYIDVTK